MFIKVFRTLKTLRDGKNGVHYGVHLHRLTPMAGLFKRPRSTSWWCKYYVTDPATGTLRQIRKTTGQTSKSKAKLVAAELERTAHGVIKAGSDDAQRAKAILAEAVAEIEQGKFTALSARRHLASLVRIATGEEMPEYTTKTWIAEWLRRKARDSSKATMARYKGHAEAFLAWLGEERASRPLEAVTAQDARRWRESLQDSGRAGKTVLSYAKDISAAFRSAIREGLLAANPFSGLDALDTSDSLDRKPFTGEEVGRLLAAAPTEEWRGLILTAAFTGLRLGDAAKLQWSSIDLEARRIELMPSKTKRKKVTVRIPIQPDLLAYLLAAPVADDQPDAPVFPTLSKSAINSRAGLSLTFPKIMAAAGVDRGKASRDPEKRGAGRVTWERGFHSLRHTFTTWLRSAGVTEEDRMALTGHSTRDSHAIYSHADEAALRDAIAKLPTLPQS